MVDRAITAHSVERGLAALGRRVAVAAGALAALVSLLVDAPVWVASVRGAATATCVLVVVRLASAFLAAGPASATENEDGSR
jgi:hypothetical protein